MTDEERFRLRIANMRAGACERGTVDFAAIDRALGPVAADRSTWRQAPSDLRATDRLISPGMAWFLATWFQVEAAQ